MKYSDVKNKLNITLIGYGDKAHLTIDREDGSIELIITRLEMYERHYYVAGCAFSFDMETIGIPVANRVKISSHVGEAVKFLSSIKLISQEVGGQIMLDLSHYVVDSKRESSPGLISSLGDSMSQLFHRKPVVGSDESTMPLVSDKGISVP